MLGGRPAGHLAVQPVNDQDGAAGYVNRLLTDVRQAVRHLRGQMEKRHAIARRDKGDARVEQELADVGPAAPARAEQKTLTLDQVAEFPLKMDVSEHC